MKQIPKVFTLKHEDHRANCIHHIAQLTPDTEKPFQVIIYSAKDIRSLKQNRLYWKHQGEIEKFGLGNLHMHLKRKFLHPIYMSGTTKANIKYQLNYRALCTVKQAGVEIDFQALFEALLTTTDATVSQMAEYITRYWPYINEKGCYLTDPDTYMSGDTDSPNQPIQMSKY